MFKFIFFAVLAYVLGSIPTGVIIGKKLKGVDIREHGSKNSGGHQCLQGSRCQVRSHGTASRCSQGIFSGYVCRSCRS